MRALKTVLLLSGLAMISVIVSLGMRTGLTPQWTAMGIALIVIYAALGVVSYRGLALRRGAGAASGVLTLAVAWVSFSHLVLLLGGLAITAACLVPPNRP